MTKETQTAHHSTHAHHNANRKSLLKPLWVILDVLTCVEIQCKDGQINQHTNVSQAQHFIIFDKEPEVANQSR